MFGLRMLVRLVQSDATFGETMRRSDDEYPFAACALNVSHLLVLHLRLATEPSKFCPCCGTEVSAGAVP